MSEIKGTIKQQDGTVLLPHTEADIVAFKPQGSSTSITVAEALQSLMSNQITVTPHNHYIELKIGNNTYKLLVYDENNHNIYLND